MKISDEIREWCDDAYSGRKIRTTKDLYVIADLIDRDMVELPKDADGVPIHMGDTVYGEDGRAWHVKGISLGRWTKWAEGYVVHAMGDSGQWHYLMPEWLTHTRPDSLESIADELDELVDAADSADDGSEMLANFADRIRRLAEKEEQR